MFALSLSTSFLLGLSVIFVILRIFLDFLDYMRFYRAELEQEEGAEEGDASC